MFARKYFSSIELTVLQHDSSHANPEMIHGVQI